MILFASMLESMLYSVYPERMEMISINKWKDTARTILKITKNTSRTEKMVILEDTLFIVEKEISEGLYLVTSSNPKRAARRQYKLSNKEIKIEDYDITRDINMQMLLADGWDAQDLLKRE